jgi:hypothetical protein
MVAEVFAGLSAAKAAFDIAKGLKDIHDGTLRNAAVIELQEQILTAQAAQSALIERIRELEKEVASFEKWDAEKEKYELKQISGLGAFAYMLKPDARGTAPAHWLCTQCYENRKRSVIQPLAGLGIFSLWKCAGCAAEFRTYESERPEWP